MATFTRFEDITAWKLADQLSREIHEVAQATPLARDFKLKDQILSASDSVRNNIAEGFGRSGNREFIQFLHIAFASGLETKSQLKTVFTRGYIPEEQYKSLDFLCYRTGKAIKSLIIYLENSHYKGPKYRHRTQ